MCRQRDICLKLFFNIMDQECIYIKGMVCNRCITTIRDLLEIRGFRVSKVSLGQVELEKPLPVEGLMTIKEFLKPLGFELLEDRTTSLLRQLKEAIKSLIEQNSGALSSIKLSEFLSLRFHKNYDSLAEVFSRYEGITLERYYIVSRVDKVRELLVYSEETLEEIAFQTGFSSPQHLSNQFKSVTGISPSQFRLNRRRIPENL